MLCGSAGSVDGLTVQCHVVGKRIDVRVSVSSSVLVILSFEFTTRFKVAQYLRTRFYFYYKNSSDFQVPTKENT